MMWGLGWTAGPDGDGFLELGYSQSKGPGELRRVSTCPEYDRLFELQRRLPAGPERMQVMAKMKELTVAYMPYKAHVHRIWTDLRPGRGLSATTAMCFPARFLALCGCRPPPRRARRLK